MGVDLSIQKFTVKVNGADYQSLSYRPLPIGGADAGEGTKLEVLVGKLALNQVMILDGTTPVPYKTDSFKEMISNKIDANQQLKSVVIENLQCTQPTANKLIDLLFSQDAE